MNEETAIEELLQEAYRKMEASDLEGTLRFLDQALEIDIDHGEVVYAMRCLRWWQERIDKLPNFQDALDKGGYILSQFKYFYGFLDLIGGSYERGLYAVKACFYSMALRYFQDLLGDRQNQYDPGLLLQVGRCYKGVGDYEKALQYMEQAARFKREDGETLSELADVNALLDEPRKAKVLFREAFFVDPQGVDLRSLESDMILLLADRVQGAGFSGTELSEWIPVFGCILGVFSVKRELRQVELARLKQSIFSLENEIRSRPKNESLLKPRLINRYFWLIDHYEIIREESGLIDETMLKIKLCDPQFYDRYLA